MIRLPLIQTLSVQNYALYPGSDSDRSGLTASFLSGLTLVLGANGLGKTTFVWLLYRMLSGPYDIPGLDKGGRLGRRRLEARLMTPTTRRLFAQRVEDNARNGTARLQFDLGSAHVTVTRRLSNLDLLGFSINGTDLEADEDVYKEQIAALSGVWSFGDWILLLRYLTFYFEDRRALVWDPTAQTQLFRLLFLPPETAQQWTETERQILELDSQARNLRAALTREEQHLAKDEELELAAPEVRAELDALSDLQEQDDEERERLDEAVVALYPAREKARLGLLDAEHNREEALRALEHAKLAALRERFPTASETAQYILAQLFAEGECLACGNDAPQAAATLESRLHRSRCVVCNTPTGQPAGRDDEITDLSEKRLANAAEILGRANARLIAARTRMEESESEYADYHQRRAGVEIALSERSTRMDSLIRQLPEEARELHRQRDELAVLRGRVDSMMEELSVRREKFAHFIERVKERIITHAPLVRDIFVSYAREFLLEDCDLRWSTLAQRVGQTGVRIDFPVFELDLASASYLSPVRRSGPEEVSESQREFIDLSFRMALMEAAASEAGATLVIDAPESSLDAIFVRKAAEVLARFGNADDRNRLVVTSNLTDGDLVPRLLEKCGLDSRGQRIA